MQSLDKSRKFIPVNIAVLTVSDSRTSENDKSGDYLVSSILEAGHKSKFRKIVKDDVDSIIEILDDWLSKILTPL